MEEKEEVLTINQKVKILSKRTVLNIQEAVENTLCSAIANKRRITIAKEAFNRKKVALLDTEHVRICKKETHKAAVQSVAMYEWSVECLDA